MIINTLFATLILINLITFLSFGVDKYLAIAKKRRIRENRLLVLAIIGGSVGTLLGQKIFRHKTQKLKNSKTQGYFMDYLNDTYYYCGSNHYVIKL